MTKALPALITALGDVMLNQMAGPMAKTEQVHRQYLRVRAAWQCQVVAPCPVRTRRRRLTAVLTPTAIIVVMVAAVLLVAMFR